MRLRRQEKQQQQQQRQRVELWRLSVPWLTYSLMKAYLPSSMPSKWPTEPQGWCWKSRNILVSNIRSLILLQGDIQSVALRFVAQLACTNCYSVNVTRGLLHHHKFLRRTFCWECLSAVFDISFEARHSDQTEP